MKFTNPYSQLLVCFSLFALPAAFAGDPDETFAKMDADNDGQITQVEHAEGARSMFKETDRNRNGVVTADEMDRMMARTSDKDRAQKSGAEKIRLMDEDGDGRVTAKEYAKASREKFGKMDTNGDGSLSKEEVTAAYQMKQKHEQDS